MGMGVVVISGSQHGERGSTLAQNARDVGSSPVLGTIFTIFSTPMTHACMCLYIQHEIGSEMWGIWLYQTETGTIPAIYYLNKYICKYKLMYVCKYGCIYLCMFSFKKNGYTSIGIYRHTWTHEELFS